MIAWCVRALLALMLSMSPLAAASAAPMDRPMAACGSMDDDGDDRAVACAMAGGCLILPTPQTALKPVIYRPRIDLPPTAARGADFLSGPEPPPPRARVA